MKSNIFNSRRFKHGSVSLALTVFIVVAAIMLNVAVTMLANNYNWMYIDMTSEQLFTLSGDCIDLLDRSFVKIMENRKSLNDKLPETNHGIAEGNIATAEKNVTVAETAIITAETNIAVARLNKLAFEQSVIKARTNVNIATSNLDLAKMMVKHAAAEAGRAEGETVAESDMTDLEKLAAACLAVAEENMATANENLITAANNAKTAEENEANKKYNDQNALTEKDEGYRPMKDYTPLKDYKPYTEADSAKENLGVEFIDHEIYKNLTIAEENLTLAKQNLEIAKENLVLAKANELLAKENASSGVIAGQEGYRPLGAYTATLEYIPYETVSNFTEPNRFSTITKAASFNGERELYETDVKVKIIFCDLPDNIRANDSLNLVYETARDLADRFPGYISVENVDIWNNATAVQKYKTTTYTSIGSTNVIIESGTEFRVCTLRSFFVFDSADASSPWGYSGEKTFASNILSVTQAESPIACITVNHGEVLKDYQLLYTLQDAGYKVQTIDLAYHEIPEDCRLLVVYDPVQDCLVRDGVSDISEIEKIDRFLDGLNCAMMVFVDPETPKLPNFEEYLEEWGVVINRHTDNLGDTYGSVIQESAAQGLFSNGYTFSGTYVKGGAGGSVYKLLSEKSNPPMVMFANSTSLSYSDLYSPSHVVPEDSSKPSYDCASYASNGVYRTAYDIFVTSDGAKMMANGNEVGNASRDGAYKLMTITRESQIVDNEPVYSSVIVCASTEFVSETMLASPTYGNSDVLLSTSRNLGEELIPVDLDYKMFASTEITTMTTQSKNVWTTVLAVIPAVIVIGVGVFVLVRRRYS